MKAIRTPKLTLLAATGAVLLAASGVQQAQAQNANHNTFDDLAFYFLKDAAVDTSLVVVALPTLTQIRNAAFASTGGYTILNAGTAVDTALDTAFGTNWATQTDLFAGAASVRSTAGGTAIYVDTTITASGDPRRTLYFTQPRATNSNPGVADSASTTLSNAPATTAGNNINASVLSTLEAGSGFAVVSDHSTSTIDEQVDVTGGNSFANLNSTVNTFSSSFSFGTAGSGVILALDLWRMMPTGATATGRVDFPDEVLGTSTLMGQVVLKNTGEIGFVAIPEPSTYALVALGAAAILFLRRRKAVQA